MIIGLGVGLGFSSSAGAGAQTLFASVLGESGSGGYAVNTDLTAGELAARPAVQIWHNTANEFQDLDIGTNNLISHTGFTDNSSHGIENGLANTVVAGRWPTNTAYLLKSGQGGSVIAEWATGHGSGYWSTFVSRYTAASAALDAATVSRFNVVILSLGINDAIAGTATATYKAGMIDLISRIRTLIGATTRVIVTKFNGPNMTERAAYNTALDEIAASDALTTALDTTGLPVRDVNHWDAQGFRMLAEDFADAMMSGAALATPTMSPAGGTYESTQSVTISGPSGASIRYTLDGSEPTSSSTLYTGAVTVTLDQALKARAFARNRKASDVASELYSNAAPSWVTWGTLQNASQSGDYLQSDGGSPGGGTSTTTIDATQPFNVVIDWPSSSETEAIIVFLDEDSASDYAWTSGGRDFNAGVYSFGSSAYTCLNSFDVRSAGSATFPSIVRMRKSGDDIIVEQSTDAGENWTHMKTETGVIAGATTLYLGALYAVPGASKKIRVRVET